MLTIGRVFAESNHERVRKRIEGDFFLVCGEARGPRFIEFGLLISRCDLVDSGGHQALDEERRRDVHVEGMGAGVDASAAHDDAYFHHA